MYNEIISKPISVVNSNTGEIKNYSSVFIENRILTKAKRGWTKMYRIGYDNIARSMTSSLEYDIFTYIRDSYEPGSFVLNYSQLVIVKHLKTTRNTVSKVIKKLKHLDFIRQDGRLIRMNPFIYVPPNLKDDAIASAQDKWNTIPKENDDKNRSQTIASSI